MMIFISTVIPRAEELAAGRTIFVDEVFWTAKSSLIKLSTYTIYTLSKVAKYHDSSRRSKENKIFLVYGLVVNIVVVPTKKLKVFRI